MWRKSSSSCRISGHGLALARSGCPLHCPVFHMPTTPRLPSRPSNGRASMITLRPWQWKHCWRWPQMAVWQQYGRLQLPQVRLWSTSRHPTWNKQLTNLLSVSWVKGHQDHHTLWNKLSLEALANCLANDICTETHQQHPNEVGHLPDWIPGTGVALLHHGKLVTKKQDKYVCTAATAPQLCDRFITTLQHHDPYIANNWDDDTFNDINWKSVCASLDCLSKGQLYQLSKFLNNWTPTLHHRATQDNSIDRRCFACRAWQETIDHVLRCSSDHRVEAQEKAKITFLDHLTYYHTPAPMAQVIMAALDWWFQDLQPYLVPWLSTAPDDPNHCLHQLINDAFAHQSTIGWGHFLCGHILLHWKSCIAKYYKIRQPGEPHNPSQKMEKPEMKIMSGSWEKEMGQLEITHF